MCQILSKQKEYMKLKTLKNLNENEKSTFKLHSFYSAINGLIGGTLILNEYIFIKSLHGSSYQLGMLFQFSVVVLIFSIFFNELVQRSKNKKRMIRWVAFLTHLPLLLLLFFPKNPNLATADTEYHYIFLLIFFIYFLARPLIFPTINLFLKHNYSEQNFGKLYSYSTSISKITMLFATFIFGLLLDYNAYIFTYVYPVLGFLGVVSIFLLAKINYVPANIVISKSIRASIKDSISHMVRTLTENKPYRHFEIGFMLYGFAFMSTKAVITIFYDVALHLTYSSVAFYQNIFNIMAIFMLPLFGKILGKIDPRKFAVITYLSLALYLLFIALTEYFPFYNVIFGIKIYYSLLIAIVFNGIFVSTMALSWSIGSAYFCRKEEAGNYQSIHLTLTGLRALFAPLLGIVFYEIIGFTGTFSIGIISLILAAILMIWSYKVFRNK